MNMEFLYRNRINTTTSITVDAGSTTVGNIFDRKKTQFIAVMPTTTATTLTAHFVVNDTINRIIIQDCNFKNFSIQYSGTTFSLTAGDTVASSWSTNSATSLYLTFATTTVNTVTLIVNSNTASTLSHTMNQMWFTEQIYQLERNPEAKDYKTKQDRQEYVHKLADGGTTQFIIDDYFDATIKGNYVTSAEKDALRSLYDLSDAFVFVPFPTSTSWNNEIYETVWIGDFEFIQRAHNIESNGYTGSIRLKETGK